MSHCVGLTAGFVLFIGFCHSALAAEPLRDPWKGFGLGSWVKIEELREQIRDGKTETVRLRETHRVNRTGPANSIQITHEDGSTSESMHIHGGLPEEMGLKKTGMSKVQFVVDGKEYEAVATKYVSDPDDPRLELLAKPYPEIMRQGGLKGEQGAAVRLTLWEVDGMDIPYAEMQLPGLDLALGPQVVHAEIILLQSDEHGKVLSRETHRRTVTSPGADLTVSGEKVRCAQVKLQGEVARSAGKDKTDVTTYQGHDWLSNDVPGRMVMSSVSFKAEDRSGSRTQTVTAFKSLPVEGFMLNDLPPLAERAVIPADGWRGMHLGAWRVRFTANIRPQGVHAFGSITRVVAIRADGTMIIENRGFDGEGKLEEPSYRVVESGDDTNRMPWSKWLPLESGKEELDFGEEKLTTHWKALKAPQRKPTPSSPSPPGEFMVQTWWMEKPNQRLAPLPLDGAVQVLEYRSSRDSFSVHRSCELSRLVNDNWDCEVKGNKIEAAIVLSYETQGDEKEYPYETWKATFFSDDLLGGEFLDIYRSLQNDLVTFSVLIGWGEFEDRSPDTPEEVLASVRRTSPLVRRALAELDKRINDKAFHKEFVETKSVLETRLLKMGETAARP